MLFCSSQAVQITRATRSMITDVITLIYFSPSSKNHLVTSLIVDIEASDPVPCQKLFRPKRSVQKFDMRQQLPCVVSRLITVFFTHSYRYTLQLFGTEFCSNKCDKQLMMLPLNIVTLCAEPHSISQWYAHTMGNKKDDLYN